MSKKLVVEILVLFACVFLLSVTTALAPCYPPDNNSTCEGNLDYDCDVDGTDAFKFKSDFGRSSVINPCPPAAGPAPVPKTGHTTNWFPYDDGSTQCGKALPDPRFTDNGDGTVSDNLTGLIWLKDAGCLKKAQTCSQAMVECMFLNSGDCGLNDGSVEGEWRLPTIRELFSIVDFGKISPATPTDMFLNVADCDGYCHSTPYSGDKDYALIIKLWSGEIYKTIGSANFGALCVRPGAYATDYCCDTYPCPGSTPITSTTSLPSTTTTAVVLGWDIQKVDFWLGDYGWNTSIALDSNEIPHIAYHVVNPLDDFYELRIAYPFGTSWARDTVEYNLPYRSSCMVIDSNDNAHISYYDINLYYSNDIGMLYDELLVDTCYQCGVGNYKVGEYNSIAVDSTDLPRISYSYKYYSSNYGWVELLKYAYWNGSEWVKNVVGEYSGGEISFALDSNNNPHIVYWNDGLKHTYWNGSSWDIQSVPLEYGCGGSLSFALDSNGNPTICYACYSGVTQSLKYSFFVGNRLFTETVETNDEGSGHGYAYTSMALDSDGHPHISYYDWWNEDLKYANRVGLNNWVIQTVDSNGNNVGWHTSIVLDSDNHPHISYTASTYEVRYATFNGLPHQ